MKLETSPIIPSSHALPLYELEGKGWTPFGFPMSQNRMALPTWSYAMEKYPPKTIVEIGTNCGGFTCVLGVHAWRIGARVYTFDLFFTMDRENLDLANMLGINRYEGDCFGVNKNPIISLIKSPGVCYLLCDGGDKVKEFHTFAEYLKPGDVIGAHDYAAPTPEGGHYWPWREIEAHQVAPSVDLYNLKPFYQELFDVAGWLVYRKEK